MKIKSLLKINSLKLAHTQKWFIWKTEGLTKTESRHSASYHPWFTPPKPPSKPRGTSRSWDLGVQCTSLSAWHQTSHLSHPRRVPSVYTDRMLGSEAEQPLSNTDVIAPRGVLTTTPNAHAGVNLTNLTKPILNKDKQSILFTNCCQECKVLQLQKTVQPWLVKLLKMPINVLPAVLTGIQPGEITHVQGDKHEDMNIHKAIHSLLRVIPSAGIGINTYFKREKNIFQGKKPASYLIIGRK